MSWIYEQSSGSLTDPNGKLVAIGYAGGNCGKNPEGVNNHAMQDVPCIGPLPVGTYTMGEPVPESKLGPYAIPLHPSLYNQMFGRGGFYCHGDTVPSGNASEGCMIFPRNIRDDMGASDDKTVEVTYVETNP